MESFEIKHWDEAVAKALTGRGARGLSGDNVDFLIEYVSEKPYKLARVEAKRIEPQYDRDMPDYSIYGALQSSGNGFETDRSEMIALFRKLNAEAQTKEKFAVRYDIWLVE